MAIGMVGIAIFAIAPKGLYIMIGAGITLTGLTLPITGSLTATYYQTTVPLDKMGRVGSISGTISASILPIGTILSGPLAEILGIPTLFFLCSVLSLIVIVAVWGFSNIESVDFDNNAENKELLHEKINNIK
jgi:DHA3 family macrolide efflux protein-like MFS transporter